MAPVRCGNSKYFDMSCFPNFSAPPLGRYRVWFEKLKLKLTPTPTPTPTLTPMPTLTPTPTLTLLLDFTVVCDAPNRQRIRPCSALSARALQTSGWLLLVGG
jgi:hypothetical protein